MPTPDELLTPALTAIVVGVGTVITQALNARRGKKRDTAGTSTLERIEKKIDDNHLEVRKTCEILSMRLDDVEQVAEDALSQAVGPGPDRKNGLKSRVAHLEAWQESEAIRERARLAQLERDREMDLRLGPDRRMGPTDVGSLRPAT